VEFPCGNFNQNHTPLNRLGLLGRLLSITKSTAIHDDQIFKFRFETDEGDLINVNMSESRFKNLTLQCAAILPNIITATNADTEEVYRAPARAIKNLCDGSTQKLLSNCYSVTLLNFLWFMKDDELNQQVLRNISDRAGEMLTEDLQNCWHEIDPDTTLESISKQGRVAVAEVMDILRKLIADNQIEPILKG
jgi:hypothetical protein